MTNDETKQTVLITGAAGSLGRAFVRFLHQNYNIIALDHNEWAIATLSQEFATVKILLKDFNQWRFEQDPCDIVIHTAAYKHVDLGEINPHTFIENNVEKTGKLFAECYKHNVDILFISTDKAVEPISTYGFTKALGERLAWHYQGSVARLGNILNSSGSVIPTWEKAITEQQPIPITDERMKRYMIEDIEAVTQIWSGFLQGHKLIVPTMPEVRIMDLLKETLNKHNYEQASDYSPGVTLIGMREGEKMNEKLRWDWE